MAKGDPQVRAHVVQCFKNATRDMKQLKQLLVHKKKNLDAEDTYNVQREVHFMEAEMKSMLAHLSWNIRVRKEDQPTSKDGGKRVRKHRQ